MSNMRKILLLIASLCIAFLVLTGCQRESGGNVTSTTTDAAAPSGAPRKSGRVSGRELRDLQTLGYLAGYNAADSAKSGVIVNKGAAVAPGHTLFASGHSPTVLLLRSDGEVLHTWYAPFEKVFPEHVESVKSTRGGRTTYWRHFSLFRDGSLAVIFEGIGIAKLDKDSNVIWALRNGAHHDSDLRPDNSLVTLSRDLRTEGKATYVNDCISIISADGKEIERISIVDAILGSPFEKIVFRRGFRGRGDVLHTNSIQELPAGVPLPPGTEPGDFLLSFRTTNSLAVVSKRTKKTVWAFREGFRTQHAASVLNDGSLILFDNIGSGVRNGPSRILRYELPSMKVLDRIEPLEGGRTFFSRLLGDVFPLENGNYLIISSEAGHLIEITPAREIVWEYRTPYRVGENDEYVAVISHAERVSADDVNVWLRER